MFKTNYQSYISKNFSVIPVIDGKPAIEGWTKFSKSLPSAKDLQDWENRFENAGIGLCLGKMSGVIGLRFNLNSSDASEKSLYQTIKSILPEPIIKIDPNGFTAIYGFSDLINKHIFFRGKPIISVQSNGTFTELHTSNCHWHDGKTLLKTNVFELPTLKLEDIDKIEDILSKSENNDPTDPSSINRKQSTQVAVSVQKENVGHANSESSSPKLQSSENVPQSKADKDQRKNDHKDTGSATKRLLESLEEIELFHTANHEGYACIPTGISDGKKVLGLRTRDFELFLSKEFYDRFGGVPTKQQLQEVIGALEGKARFDSPEYEVFMRFANHNGNIYIDLGGPRWDAVEITKSGWSVVESLPVKFRRPKGMLELPCPERGGNINELRDFLNLKDESDWQLLVGWILGVVRSKGPFPHLAITGEQGSCKSTATQLLKSLLDPSSAPLRGEPKDLSDLVIASQNNGVVVLDNLSGVKDWLSDALCRLATGGGFATRELYSNSEEVIFNVQKPAILNGIEAVSGRSDLIDRCIALHLPAVLPHQRKPESTLLAAFKASRPRILGAIYDVVALTMLTLGSQNPGPTENLPRMADFAVWVIAAEKALGWASGSFLVAYNTNRDALSSEALDSSFLATTLSEFMHSKDNWTGTASELLDDLNRLVDDRTRYSRQWPKSPNYLSGQLARIAPNLRNSGIDISTGSRRVGSTVKRFISIYKRESIVNVVNSVNKGEASGQLSGIDDLTAGILGSTKVEHFPFDSSKERSPILPDSVQPNPTSTPKVVPVRKNSEENLLLFLDQSRLARGVN